LKPKQEIEKFNVLHPITRMIVGGAQENTMYTAEMLDYSRFHTEILCGPQTGSEGSLIEETRQRDVPMIIIPDLVRQISPLQDMRTLRNLTSLVRANQYSIVHTHSSKAGILGRLAARNAGVPIIIHTVHGWSFHEYLSTPVRALYIMLERWAAKFTDALIVVAERDIHKGLNVKIGKPNQYKLIRSAIPLEEFDPSIVDRQSVRRELGIPENAPVVGNVGRFSEQKNPLDWTRVAGIIGRSHPSVHFLLVGDGPLRAQVFDRLEQEGIAERTILTGLRRDIPPLISAMDIFLLTSLWEGLPRVIPQSMAMRKPVVAFRVDGVSEAIHDGQTGFLCSPGDVSAMAQRCSYLIENPVERKVFGESGRAYTIEEFNLYKMIAQIEDVYETLIDQKLRLPKAP
jgi:glycosyltransferase involved in cell wall biosynthesis